MNRLRQIAAVLAVAAAGLSLVIPGYARSRKTDSWQEGAAERKADYLFMEAMRQNTLDNDDAFFELLDRSCALDSADTSAGSTLGYYYMALGQQDSTMARQGFEMMRRHFNAHPEDYYSSIFYGMVNGQLGNTAEAVRIWQTLDSLNPTKPDVALRYADALQATFDTANLRRSIDVISRIQRAEGPDLGLTSHKVRAMLALRDTASTLGELHALLDQSPRNATFNIYAGDVFSAMHMPDSAISYYNRACEIDSANGLAYMKRAEFYKEHGDSAAFDREVFQALRQESLELPVKLDMLTSYIRQLYTDTLQQPRIQKLFDVLLTHHPHEADIRDLYASYLYAINDLPGAAEQQELALDIDPSAEQRWRMAMSLYSQSKNEAKAIQVGERALHYLPESPMINLMLGASYQQLDNQNEAIRYFEKAEQLADTLDNEMRSQILASIGDSYYKLEKKDSAFVYYDRAIEVDPDNLLALNNCAYYLAEEGRDLDRAETMSAICVRANPENDTALDTYAWIFFRKKDFGRAKEFIDRALAVEGDSPAADVLSHAGDIYYFYGDRAQALEYWQQALKLTPDDQLLKKKVKLRRFVEE